MADQPLSTKCSQLINSSQLGFSQFRYQPATHHLINNKDLFGDGDQSEVHNEDNEIYLRNLWVQRRQCTFSTYIPIENINTVVEPTNRTY